MVRLAHGIGCEKFGYVMSVPYSISICDLLGLGRRRLDTFLFGPHTRTFTLTFNQSFARYIIVKGITSTIPTKLHVFNHTLYYSQSNYDLMVSQAPMTRTHNGPRNSTRISLLNRSAHKLLLTSLNEGLCFFLQTVTSLARRSIS